MGLRLSQWVLRLSSLKKKRKKGKKGGKKKTCSWTFEEGCSGWAFDSPWPCQWEEIALPADNIFHRVSSQVEPLALVISPGISLSFVCAEGEPQPYQGADVRKESVRIGTALAAAAARDGDGEAGEGCTATPTLVRLSKLQSQRQKCFVF